MRETENKKMTDPVSVGALLTSIKTATGIAKFFRDSDINLQKAESKAKIADLISAMADVKIQTADLQEVLLEKDKHIRELKTKLSIKDNLRFERPYYWLAREDKSKDGPYCPHCKDKDDKLIRLQSSEPGNWYCSVCSNVYYDKEYVEPEPQDPNWNAFT
jgi:hypothetical protein